MPDQPPPDPIDDLVDRYLDHLDRGQTPPTADQLPEADRAEATATLDWLRDLRRTNTSTHRVPALVDDPVAVRLGLVPQPEITVAGPAVAAARHRRGLDLARLAALVGEHGQSISIRDLSRLERTSTTALPAGTAQALAAVLEVPVDALNPTGAQPDDRGLSAFLTSAAFRHGVFGWADRHGQEPQAVAARVKKRLRSVRFRGAGHGSTEEWLALLRSVLDDLD
jgi:transcriptional regulator with XRE-family HTH domain